MKISFMKFKEWCFTNILLLLVIFSIFLFSLLYHFREKIPNDKLPETFIAIAVFLGTISYNMINYKIAHEQFFRQIFTDFNKRFDLMNDALNQIRIGEKEIKYENTTKTRESIILDYLNLCSEEYLWFSKRRIDLKVWIAWRQGMDYYLKSEHFIEIFEKQKAERSSYYGLIEELEIKRTY